MVKNLETMNSDSYESDMEAVLSRIAPWLSSSRDDMAECLSELKGEINNVESFTLLANIFLINHLNTPGDYADFQGDRVFIVSELVAMIALQGQYVERNAGGEDNLGNSVEKVQALAFKLWNIGSLIHLREAGIDEHSSIESIAFKMKRDEKNTRNPVMPEHHREISAELYLPLDEEIKKEFGFSVSQSILLRESIIELINEKLFVERNKITDRTMELAAEVFHFRKTGTIPENPILTEDEIRQFNQYSRSQIRETSHHKVMSKLFNDLGMLGTFTAKELSDYSGVSPEVTNRFLARFSRIFGSIPLEADITDTGIAFRERPLIMHNGRYMTPSLPLLNFSVEPVIESYIKSKPGLLDSFGKIKHDFLMKRGIGLLSGILRPTKIYQNLKYINGSDVSNVFETDGLIAVGRTLFIIEGKGNRITPAAKQGRVDRVETHMKEIIRKSYEQGLRTLDFIEASAGAIFKDSGGQKIVVKKGDYDQMIILSLVLEPIGNLTPIIKTSGGLDYFRDGVFPWIVSLFDLIVIADHIEIPALLIHYINRREAFLSNSQIQVYEEMDIFAKYLRDGLDISYLAKQAATGMVDMIHIGNETDAINNYYIQKNIVENPEPPKLQPNMPSLFMQLIRSLESSLLDKKQDIQMLLLEMRANSKENFVSHIRKVKSMFANDGGDYNCSIMIKIGGIDVGFSLMTSSKEAIIAGEVQTFCFNQMMNKNARMWICFGDINRTPDNFSITAGFITTR